MKTKYKHSIEKIYYYCRWNHRYPPDDWCLFGLYKWWFSTKLIQYRLCMLGFELRIDIKRNLIN